MMKTLTLNQQNMIRRVLLLLLLVAAFSITFVFAAKPVHAHEIDGSYAVGEDGIEGITEDDQGNPINGIPTTLDHPTTFDLHYVGTFDGHDSDGNAILKLKEEYAADGLQSLINGIKKEDYDDDNTAWTKAWLGAAQDMWDYVREHEQDYSYNPRTVTVDTDGKFKVEDVDNGLYLLVGESQEVHYNGREAYWWPQPMLILVWNGDVKIGVKPQVEYITHIKVNKIWDVSDDPEDIAAEQLARPESLNIKLYYDGTLKHEIQLPRTEGNNTVWYSKTYKVGKGENDPSKWYAIEELTTEDLKSYTIEKTVNFVNGHHEVDGEETTEISDDANRVTEVINITNKYDRCKLKIKKSMDVYVNNGEDLSTSIVFKITGYKIIEGTKTKVYEKTAGMQFSGESGATNEITVKNVPKVLDELVVEEAYGGNNTAKAGESTKTYPGSERFTYTADEEGYNGVYTVEFENEYDNNTHLNGIINKYKIENGTFTFDEREGYPDKAK